MARFAAIPSSSKGSPKANDTPRQYFHFEGFLVSLSVENRRTMVGAADRRLESSRHSPAVGQPVRVPSAVDSSAIMARCTVVRAFDETNTRTVGKR